MKTKQIGEIIENFDFDLVLMVMQQPILPEYDDDGNLINRHVWKMYLGENRYEIPNKKDLIKRAVDLLLSIADSSDDKVSATQCGPFKATNWYGNLSLEFVPTEWHYED